MKEAKIKTESFNHLIDATKQFVDKNNCRDTYKYIRLEFDAESSTVTAIAVDGYRMSVEHSVISDCDENFSAYIKPNVKLPKNMYARISVSDEETIISCGDFRFGYRIPHGDFLDWEKVIPKSDAHYKIGFNGNYMLNALQSAKISLGGNFRKPVVLEFRGPTEPIILRTNGEDIKMVLPMKLS